MDETDKMFGMLRRGPFSGGSMYDPGQTAYDSQPGGMAPQGFLDDFVNDQTDFILYGVYNGAFSSGPPLGVGTNLVAVTNELPNWGAPVQVSGNAITCQWVEDSASPSGHNLRFVIAAGAADDEAYVEQVVPIGGARRRTYDMNLRASVYRVVASGSSPLCRVGLQYLTADRTTTTGAAASAYMSMTADATLYAAGGRAAGANSPPADAVFLRIRIGVARDTMAATDTATIDLADVRVDRGGSTLFAAEQTSGATYSASEIYQSQGYLYVAVANQTGNGVAIRLIGGPTQLPEQATPGTPSPGYYSIYPKTDGKLYGKNDAGTEVELGGGGGSTIQVVRETGSTSIAADTATNITVTWPSSFGDTNYTPWAIAVLDDTVKPPMVSVKSKTATQTVFRVHNQAASSKTISINAFALDD